LIVGVLGATLISAGALTAHAAEGVFYDPSNAASPTGKTTGAERFGTIGCPGRQLLDQPCPKPVDTDGDGVVDSKDKCPGTPAGRKVNADGCELDSDGDGVVDGADKCPGTAAGRKVSAEGCELDSDGDGLVDGVDKCPTASAKTADGCPLPVAAPVAAPVPAVPRKLVLEGVNFDTGKAKLREDAYPILDEAAEGLKEWGGVKVEIGGYTDSKGSEKLNQTLSQARAEAVRVYLIGKGILGDRLTAKGYGESSPVADNDTEEGRFKNRRVEFVEQK
jgi:OOP family OmpA-OmpF porin